MLVKIVDLGLQDYETTWQAMQQFNDQRTVVTSDELWIVEHHPVYTLGLNGKTEHLLNIGDIPVVKCDRGGQVTYHGPGQVVIYTLLDVQRLQLNARSLVTILEQAMITSLAQLGIEAVSRPEAPGVYVKGQKIGSIGLRIKKQGSYHGLSLNNAMDLRPFDYINPCGYSGLKVTQLSDLGVNVSSKQLANSVIHAITATL
ncbi:MAG: lipoyl(octanoyl) transferase LipB [Methylococcales bacterium]|nr:lipoyl(octanoyl) transferase LipB [Methylococcales bacterium]